MLKRKLEEEIINIQKNVKKMKINEEKNKINQKRKLNEPIDKNCEYVNYKRMILMYL